MEQPIKVGFVGLGIMGSPMAANLLKAGFTVSVYNRTPAKSQPLAAQGAAVAASLPELAGSANIVITIVSDTPDVEAVLFGEQGLAASLKPGSVIVDMSTISPRATAAFAERLRKQNVAMLDAPVSGGEAGAIAGTLSIMVGGDRETFERCLPVFQAMGRNVVHAGPNGSGQKTKMVNQVVGSLNLLASVEGLRLASAAGLDLETTLKAVGAGAAGSWILSNLGPKIIKDDFRPGFSIRLQQKDLRLALEYLHELKLDAPGTELTLSLFTQALEKGLGESGNQGLYQLWQ